MLFLVLIEYTNQLEHISTHQFIIAIHNHQNIMTLTIVMSCIPQIICCIFPFLILHKCNLFILNSDFFCILFGRIEGVVLRNIVDENDMIVIVVLHRNSIHDFFISIVLNVVVTENNNTHGRFCFVLTNLI